MSAFPKHEWDSESDNEVFEGGDSSDVFQDGEESEDDNSGWGAWDEDEDGRENTKDIGEMEFLNYLQTLWLQSKISAKDYCLLCFSHLWEAWVTKRKSMVTHLEGKPANTLVMSKR